MSIIDNYLKQNKVTHTFTNCQWPIGDPQEKEFHFCEALTVQGKPYCKEHCDVAYIDERELKKEKETNNMLREQVARATTEALAAAARDDSSVVQYKEEILMLKNNLRN